MIFLAHNNVGERVKKLRKSYDMTLKDLSQATGFSIGFLSQLERGLTTIAIESLEKIGKAMNVDITYFFDNTKSRDESVIKSYEREVFRIVNDNIIYHLSYSNDSILLPRIIEILPTEPTAELYGYSHEGEEFIYVLEGVLTLSLKNEVMELYPGDTAHYSSLLKHDWSNHTNRLVKLIVVNYPNTFNKSDE